MASSRVAAAGLKMSFEVAELAQWLWTVFLGAFWFLWREIKSIRGVIDERERVIHSHDKDLAVLNSMIEAQTNQMSEIKAGIARIELQLSGKADK